MNNFFSYIFYKIRELKSKISINPFFWIVIISSLITGQFIEIITLFAIVIIHELGHIFAAKSYGWKIKGIELLPFGGVAKVEQPSNSVWEEFVVAVSGPLQNLMMIIIAIGFFKLKLWSNEWTIFFIQANTWIGLFNLFPVAPLDGNKILKSGLYLLFTYRRALMLSIFISFVITIIFLIWASGINFARKPNINAMALAVFFVYSNWLEIREFPFQFWRFLLHKLHSEPKRNVSAISIIVNQETLVIQALRLLRKERYHLFYLISDNGEIIKIVPEEKILKKIVDEKELYIPLNRLIT